VRGADLTTFMCRMLWKFGSLNLLEPSGPHRACYGTPLPLYFDGHNWHSCHVMNPVLQSRQYRHHSNPWHWDFSVSAEPFVQTDKRAEPSHTYFDPSKSLLRPQSKETPQPSDPSTVLVVRSKKSTVEIYTPSNHLKRITSSPYSLQKWMSPYSVLLPLSSSKRHSKTLHSDPKFWK